MAEHPDVHKFHADAGPKLLLLRAKKIAELDWEIEEWNLQEGIWRGSWIYFRGLVNRNARMDRRWP